MTGSVFPPGSVTVMGLVLFFQVSCIRRSLILCVLMLGDGRRLLMEEQRSSFIRCLVIFHMKIVVKVQADFSTLSPQSCDPNRLFFFVKLSSLRDFIIVTE